VVDDNATNREILTVRVKSWGYASGAQDGAAALRALTAAQIEGDPFEIAFWI